MANISNRQIAELLVGIARAQQAIVEAIESSRPGFRSTHLSPALMNAARVRDTHRPLQLALKGLANPRAQRHDGGRELLGVHPLLKRLQLGVDDLLRRPDRALTLTQVFARDLVEIVHVVDEDVA